MVKIVLRRAVTLALGVAVTLILSPPASAKVANATLEQLAQGARVIVVAHVDRLTQIGGARVALATVVEPLGGLLRGQQFAFLAERTWTCDSSDAVAGETALLFLTVPGDGFGEWVLTTHPRWPSEQSARLGDRPFYQIEWSGYGRMPIEQRVGKDYLLAWKGPATLHPTQRPAQTAFWVGGVELSLNIHGIADPGRPNDGSYRGKHFLVAPDEVERIVRRFPRENVPLSGKPPAPAAGATLTPSNPPPPQAPLERKLLEALFVAFMAVGVFCSVWAKGRRWRTALRERQR